MADYDWFDRTPTEAENTGNRWRSQGLHPVYKDAHTMGGSPLYIQYYECRRGCGTIVHDPATHIKNVCPEFNPVAG